MNINDEIQERLRKGETLDSIAASITKALNDAVAEQKAAERKAQEEAKREEAHKATHRKVAEKLREAFLMLTKDEFPEAYDEVSATITTDAVLKELEEGIEGLRALVELKDMFSDKPSKSKKIKSADDVIADFLTEYGL